VDAAMLNILQFNRMHNDIFCDAFNAVTPLVGYLKEHPSSKNLAPSIPKDSL